MGPVPLPLVFFLGQKKACGYEEYTLRVVLFIPLPYAWVCRHSAKTSFFVPELPMQSCHFSRYNIVEVRVSVYCCCCAHVRRMVPEVTLKVVAVSVP